MASTHNKVRYLPKSKQSAAGEGIGHGSECSPEVAEEALKLLEGRWKMVILFHLFGTPTALRFSELERAIPDVTQKMLIQQLRALEQSAIVRRTVHPQVPPKVEYSLTELGQALRPALHALVKWAALRRRTVRVTTKSGR